MVVVAIIAILASVVVPAWFRDSSRAKAKSEIAAMFAELSTKEEQYRMDNDAYLAAAPCPATARATGQVATACTDPPVGAWFPMRVSLPTQSLYCSYQIVTGPSTTPPAPPPPFTMPVPSTSWFWILATCDMDSSATLDSYYFTSNMNSSIQAQNEGS